MIEITTKEGIYLKKDEYDFLKIERNNIFLEVPSKDILPSDKLYFRYIPFINNSKNDLDEYKINNISFFLTNLTYEKDIFNLIINKNKINIYNNMFNILSKKEINNKIFLNFEKAKKENLEVLLNDFKNKKIIKKYFLNNKNNFKILMNLLLLRNSIYKNKNIELIINKNYINEIQYILFSLKIKSIINKNKLIINDKHSLMKLLIEFNIKNNLKKLKEIVKEIEIDYLCIGENQTFFLSEIKEINKA